MTHREYTYPVVIPGFSYSATLIGIDETLHRAGFFCEGELVDRPEFAAVQKRAAELYGAIEAVMAPLTRAPLPPIAQAVAIARDAAAGAGVLGELDANSAGDDDTDDEDWQLAGV